MGRRRELALTIFLAGALLPVVLRIAIGPNDARLSLWTRPYESPGI